MDVTAREILTQRLYHHGLIQPQRTGQAVLAESLGIQSQYVTHGLYNYFNRLAAPKQDTYEALTEAGILAWGQRGTYHFYDRSSWESLSQLLAPVATWPWSHFAKEGLDVDAALTQLARLLADGPLTRSALKDCYSEDYWRQFFRWGGLFVAASRQGQLYHRLGAGDRTVHWQDAPAARDLVALKVRCLDAYFRFYGPASLADAAHFFGVPQAFFKDIDLTAWPSCTYQGRRFYYGDWQPDIDLPPVLVLGKFDALLVSYQSKDILANPSDHARIWLKAGQIPALILIRGQVRGEWQVTQQGDRLTFRVTCPSPLAKAHQASIRARFRAFARWWGKSVAGITFEVES